MGIALIAIVAVAFVAVAFWVTGLFTIPTNGVPVSIVTPQPTAIIPSPQPTATPTVTPHPTTIPTPTQTPDQTQMPTSAPTTIPTQTPTPTPSPTLTPSATPTPSLLGSSRSNPAPKGTSLTIQFEWFLETYNARVTLLETIRGAEAWAKIKEANMFNDPPDQGFEYILLKIRFEYISGPTTNTKYDVSPVFFDAISSNGLEYEYKTIVPPKPWLSASLYPGASHEGWDGYQVAINDANPVLTFGRNYDGTGGIWFKLH